MLVSIVTPCYNSGRYLEQTIRSIQVQSYPYFEHIVIDGKSTDGTLDILSKQHGIQWISENDEGQADAINKGMSYTRGEILAWQNADDLYFPYTFETVVRYFQEHPRVDLVYGNYRLIDEHDKVIVDVRSKPWNRWLFQHGRFIPVQPTVFWRRKVYEEIGDLNTKLHYCMDVDFYARISKKFVIAYLPVMLGQFRIHRESKTQNWRHLLKVYQEHKTVLENQFDYNLWDSLWCDFFFIRGNLARITRITFPGLSAN